jgi:hypothetical protein
MKPVFDGLSVGENASQGSWMTVTWSSLSSAATASGKGGLAKVAQLIPQNNIPKIPTTIAASSHLRTLLVELFGRSLILTFLLPSCLKLFMVNAPLQHQI